MRHNSRTPIPPDNEAVLMRQALESGRPLWEKFDGESMRAFRAFRAYLMIDPRQRSILEAYRRMGGDPKRRRKVAPHAWGVWSRRWMWQRRLEAYELDRMEVEREEWENRKLELRRRDWEQASKLRDVVDAALAEAQGFVRSREYMDGKTRVVVMAMDITAVSRVLSDASKLQRLSTGDNTENVGLTGSALDGVIASELAKLADERKAAVITAHPGVAYTNGKSHP